MDIAQWQKRLEDNFSVDGTIGGHLFKIYDLEKRCGVFFATTYHGQSVLIDSFQSFYIETIRLAYSWIKKNGWPKDSENYSSILLFFVINFRSFRACENLFTKGYPLDGYSLLRNLKDRALFLGAITNNITTFPRYYGYSGTELITEEVRKKLKNKSKKEEHRVLDRMLRKDSGLPKDVIAELERWEQLFHEEVHGSKFTFFGELGEWLKSGKLPSIGPIPNKQSMGMYMNRSAEIGWMLVNLLPYLQLVENAFGEDWKRRQQILDDSFRVMEQELSKIGKKIADAFIALMDEKFQFPDDFYYFEADGSE